MLAPRCSLPMKCNSFAFIRDIDPQAKLFYLQTPANVEELQHVNVIVLGAIEPPVCLRGAWHADPGDGENPLSNAWQKSSRLKAAMLPH